MPQQMQDPIFGTLTFAHDIQWEKEEPISLFGHDVIVSFGHDGQAGPDDRQRAIYQQFQAKQEQLKPILQEAMFDYYQRVCEEYREAIGEEEEADEYAPILTGSDEIWRLVEASSIFIPRQDAETVDNLEYDFSISWHSTWDDEHGLQVGFRNWQVSVVDLPRY